MYVLRWGSEARIQRPLTAWRGGNFTAATKKKKRCLCSRARFCDGERIRWYMISMKHTHERAVHTLALAHRVATLSSDHRPSAVWVSEREASKTKQTPEYKKLPSPDCRCVGAVSQFCFTVKPPPMCHFCTEPRGRHRGRSQFLFTFFQGRLPVQEDNSR